MTEVQSVSEANPIQVLQQIAGFCISPNATIEPGANITLQMTRDGKRHTEIGEAHIEKGAQIKGLAHILDDVLVEQDAQVGYRTNIGEGSRVSRGAVIGIGAVLGQHVELMPSAIVGNLVCIDNDSIISWNTELKDQVIIGPGLCVRGTVGSHTTIKIIDDKQE
jgi:UDP-3-O-[3-hydroxymyristoyl] glucosamine N-acyltransferase